jgi:hypothetical protein
MTFFNKIGRTQSFRDARFRPSRAIVVARKQPLGIEKPDISHATEFPGSGCAGAKPADLTHRNQ